ncbi:MAG: hypothetical protein HY906_03430 [Deltaproteobacteria bacterium]|nr:hypothetical protein [Deltaproteobacteria bacterium]
MRPALAAIAALVLLAGTEAAAHQDYAGDTHPFVVVEQGRFVIHFKHNQDRRHYRIVVSAAGEVVSPRSAVAAAEYADYETRYKRRELEGCRYVFPQWEGQHNGRPFYDVFEKGRPTQRVQLPWGRRKVGIVHDALVTSQEVVLLVTPELQLHSFPRGGSRGSSPVSQRLGEPYTIYDFPVASNLARFKGGYVVCWIDKSQRLLLTWWRPSGGRPRTVELAAKTDWNTALSIAVIGDALLIAHHGLVGGKPGSQIKTILKRLPP